MFTEFINNSIQYTIHIQHILFIFSIPIGTVRKTCKNVKTFFFFFVTIEYHGLFYTRIIKTNYCCTINLLIFCISIINTVSLTSTHTVNNNI